MYCMGAFTNFASFWPPNHLCWHFLPYKCWQKANIFNYLPTSSCQCSFWMAPICAFIRLLSCAIHNLFALLIIFLLNVLLSLYVFNLNSIFTNIDFTLLVWFTHVMTFTSVIDMLSFVYLLFINPSMTTVSRVFIFLVISTFAHGSVFWMKKKKGFMYPWISNWHALFCLSFFYKPLNDYNFKGIHFCDFFICPWRSL